MTEGVNNILNKSITEKEALVSTIIERYVLNKDLDYKDRIYLVNPNYLQTKIDTLLAIPGDIGFTIKMVNWLQTSM
jgi:hypothetical protein